MCVFYMFVIIRLVLTPLKHFGERWSHDVVDYGSSSAATTTVSRNFDWDSAPAEAGQIFLLLPPCPQ